MIALLQRVTHAQVDVAGITISKINQGLLVFLGIESDDTTKTADRMLTRLLGYRVFADSNDKMNLSVTDISGGLLIVPQFTLAADTKKGMRPSFTPAAHPNQSKQIFDYLIAQAQQTHYNTASGEFGANMQISLCNDGPVTFLLTV